MSTYLIKSEKQITRQEGDTADVVFTVPALLNIDGADVEFAVYRSNGVRLIRKLTADCTVAGQVITVPLVAADTKLKPGNHRWELQVTIGTNIYTIGRGVFTIVNELIK